MSSNPGLNNLSGETARHPSVPDETVTLLFTDIEGSTLLLKKLRENYAALLAEHQRILREVVTRWNGHEVDTQGDAFFISFGSATQAVSAAVEIQRAFAAYSWPEGSVLSVRMGLHTGEPWKADQGYVGLDVHRAARIAQAGHGGQVLLSETTGLLVMDKLPPGVSLLSLGLHAFKDLDKPEQIYQLVIEGLAIEFPPLKSLDRLPSGTSQALEIASQPEFIDTEKTKPIFVGREIELRRLEHSLEVALTGRGGVIFITGSPGQGKTALLNEFSERATRLHPDLFVIRGGCDAYSGLGDPYLPFRDVLAMLTGDLEARYHSGLINREQTERLWKSIPESARIIVEHGSDLINRLINGNDLLARMRGIKEIHPEILGKLQLLVRSSGQTPNQPGLDQAALLGQFSNVLIMLAKRHPVVLLLDDVQWMDIGSIHLLFYLGRRLIGNKIFLVAAYRSEDVALGRDGERHPLEKVLAEFKRLYGDIWIDLDHRDPDQDKRFVADLLATEPNLLSTSFKRTLYEHTDGHPLFTIELLRNLQEQGDLILDEKGNWIEHKLINWERLPSRVEGVIEERIGRLDAEQRAILTIASVEGDEFTAQVISQIQRIDPLRLSQVLNHSLSCQHRLIIEHGTKRVNEQILFLYSFRHHLFQKFIYERLSTPEQILLHGSVSQALEMLYSGSADEISPQLARHFHLAWIIDKAIQYYTLAGRFAVKVVANGEAVVHYRNALELLSSLPASPQRSQIELDLQLSLGPPLTAVKGWAAPELEVAYNRALELCAELTNEPQRIRALWFLANYWLGRSNHDKVDSVMNQLGEIAQKTGDPHLVWMDKLQVVPLYRGNLSQARQYLESLSSLYEPDGQKVLAQTFGMAPSIIGQAYLSNCLWLLGSPELAQQSIEKAIQWADEINILFTTCYVLGRACWLFVQTGEWEKTRDHAASLLRIAQNHGFKNFEFGAKFYIEYAKIKTGASDGGELDRMHQAMEAYSAMGTILNRTSWLVFFAQACADLHQIDHGLAVIREAISLGEKTGELWLQAEAYRLEGTLLSQSIDQAGEEEIFQRIKDCYIRAIEIAKSQGAKALEILAAQDLAKMGR